MEGSGRPWLRQSLLVAILRNSAMVSAGSARVAASFRAAALNSGRHSSAVTRYFIRSSDSGGAGRLTGAPFSAGAFQARPLLALPVAGAGLLAEPLQGGCPAVGRAAPLRGRSRGQEKTTERTSSRAEAPPPGRRL